ncbi:GNAT family N-acetyltransferase [Candidatus Leptofilum sp.]|uniref:GNAT family N-acetyltransferase n=1 Tax=Candidatus Leptofilum sp. TaxID=3241576 RepID=UPI003B5AE72B
MKSIHIRLATLADVPNLNQLIIESVQHLNAPDYTPVQINSALKYIYGIDSQLIVDGTYYVAEMNGRFVGCGGWSKRRTLFGGDAATTRQDDADLLNPEVDPAKIRAFFVHPFYARQGIGRAIMAVCEAAAVRVGFRQLELMATLTGEPLYAATGFKVVERLAVELPDSVSFPGVRMVKTIVQPHAANAKWQKSAALFVMLLLMVVTVLAPHTGTVIAENPQISEAVAIQKAVEGTLGENFLISEMGTAENVFARDTAVAHNQENEFLVVWAGNLGWNVIENDSDQYIFARRVNDQTGELLGVNYIKIGVTNQLNSQPDVTYNMVDDEYFIVWTAAHLSTGEHEIYGQRLTKDGELVGVPLRLSQMGPEGNSHYAAMQPAVSHTTGFLDNNYLVVWVGDNNADSLVNDEFEIFGRYVNFNNDPILSETIRISQTGPDGDTNYAAAEPDLVYDMLTKQFMVVWRGDTSEQVGEWEIYGRILHTNSTAFAGQQVRLTHMGTDSATGYDAV